MTYSTKVTLDIGYKIDVYKVGRDYKAYPQIITVNGKPMNEDLVNTIIEVLYNDNEDFNDNIEAALEAAKDRSVLDPEEY